METVAAEPNGDPKAIERLLGQAATAFAQLGKVAAREREALEGRYVAVRGQLVTRTQALREGEDWKRWANVPRAEALVAAAKELAEREEAPTLPLLKAVQQAWKELGPMPGKKSKELWETFKAHCDAAFARIRADRAAEDEKLSGNVAAKRELVAAAQALAGSTDFDATAAAMKELQRAVEGLGAGAAQGRRRAVEGVPHRVRRVLRAAQAVARGVAAPGAGQPPPRRTS
jgi:hypothetical protein